MKCAALALVLLLGAVALSHGAGDDPTVNIPGVVDLTPSNFASEHSGRRAALIEFYAPWCGHCKRLVPAFTELGQKIAANPMLKNRVLVAKVDADAHRELGEKFGVQGFPTLKWFPRGKASAPEDYVGGRSADEFLKFIEDKVAADAGFARVESMVPMAKMFLAVPAAEKAGVVTAAETAAETVPAEDKDNAALYVRYMRKALEKGEEYIAAELERLTKMAEKPMSAAKLDEISRKISVLTSFTEPDPTPEVPAGVAAAAAEVPVTTPAEGAEEGEEVYADELDEGTAAEEGEEEEETAEDEEDEEEEEAGDAAAAEEDDQYDDSEL